MVFISLLLVPLAQASQGDSLLIEMKYPPNGAEALTPPVPKWGWL